MFMLNTAAAASSPLPVGRRHRHRRRTEHSRRPGRRLDRQPEHRFVPVPTPTTAPSFNNIHTRPDAWTWTSSRRRHLQRRPAGACCPPRIRRHDDVVQFAGPGGSQRSLQASVAGITWATPGTNGRRRLQSRSAQLDRGTTGVDVGPLILSAARHHRDAATRGPVMFVTGPFLTKVARVSLPRFRTFPHPSRAWRHAFLRIRHGFPGGASAEQTG